MKIALITDQHLDGRKGSLPFWDYWQKFYDEIFFPTLEKENIGENTNIKICALYILESLAIWGDIDLQIYSNVPDKKMFRGICTWIEGSANLIL